ncbi:MFS transporter [Stackebrandtia soli]|uniref:MFS transporter n=1 Tax=Stackebrandtia soli TaxID=1892856 RepID=UPI0039E7F00F
MSNQANAKTPHPRGHVRAILARKDFRALLGTRAASQIADGFFQGGLAVSVFFNPTSKIEPFAYAIAFAMLIAPYSVLGPYVGVFLDRWSRRNILAVSNLLRALLVVPTALVIFWGGPEIVFGSFALLVITINRFVLAGLSASQPHVVEREHLVTANAFATTLGTICFGAGLGGSYVVTRLAEGEYAYALASGLAAPLYALSALIAWRAFRPMYLGPDEFERHTGRVVEAIVETTKGMVAGFAHLWQRRGAAYSMTVQAAHRALYGVLTVVTLAVLRGHFHDPSIEDFADTLGWLAGIAAAGQVGSFLSALITPRITRWWGPGRWVTALMLLVGVTIAGVAFAMWEPAFVAATLLINIASQGTKIVVDTSLQTTVADEYRGRLFSLNDTVFNLSFVIGMFAGASLLPSDGYAPDILFGVVVGYMIVTVWYGLISTRHRPY